MLVLLFKGKAPEVWREWQLCVKAIGQVTLKELAPKPRANEEKEGE